jgi:hypothetical protein
MSNVQRGVMWYGLGTVLHESRMQCLVHANTTSVQVHVELEVYNPLRCMVFQKSNTSLETGLVGM